MAHKYDHSLAERLISPDRKRFLDPDKVLEPLELELGLAVADVGCGAGYFAAPLAEAVGPAGTVFAVDTSPEMLAQARANLESRSHTGVDFILSTESEVPLPDHRVQAALVANTLHEADAPGALFRELRRILAPGGRLLVVEWKPEQTPKGPPVTERLTPERVIHLAQAAGFGEGQTYEPGPYHYSILFEA